MSLNCDNQTDTIHSQPSLVEILTCGICWLPYTVGKRAPISLRCGHTLCRMCIQELGKHKMHVPCGICREKTYVEPKKLTKNFELIRILHYFGHLHEDAEEPIESSNNNEQSKENAQNATVVQRASRFDEQVDYEEIFPDSSTAQQVIFTTHDQSNSTAQDHAMDMNMEAVNEILHNMREAIATIRNEGDILQVFAIENQGNMVHFQRRIEPVFNEIRTLLTHPLREEMYKLIRRLERSRGLLNAAGQQQALNLAEIPNDGQAAPPARGLENHATQASANSNRNTSVRVENIRHL
uniref:RING-type domain-containing protein n=1 Tax=Acrobeloides nanus TaxID=290746 RepID=A0A914BY44_9BILA